MADEILVHISDSTTNQKDALYRNLAEEYTHFEPYISHRDVKRNLGVAHTATTGLKTPIAPAHQTSAHRMLTTSKDSYGSFPSQVSSGTRSKAKRSSNVSSDADSTDYGSTPIPTRLIQLERIQSNWRARNTPRSSFVSNGNDAQRLPEHVQYDDATFIEDTQLAAQAIQSQLPEPFYFDSGDTSEDDPESDDGRQIDHLLSSGRHDRTVGDKTGMRASSALRAPTTYFPAKASLQAAGCELGTFDSLNQEEDPVSTAEDGPGNVPVSLIPVSSTTCLTVEADLDKADNQLEIPDGLAQEEDTDPMAEDEVQPPASDPDFSVLDRSVFPPAPTISVEEPPSLPSQVTSYLAETMKQNRGRFKPSKISSVPKADDRGCWIVNCESWDFQLQAAFWASLSDHVSTGRLGWGTTLHREPTSDATIGQVRVYSWGELIEHIWLVLWLCSKGAIMFIRADWLDADGNAIIMGPRAMRD